jgi:hypothetical protein
MLDRPQAQALVDAFSALTLGASAVVLTGRPSALRSRLAFALAMLCLFFGARAVFGAFGEPLLEMTSLLVACLLPLAALLLAEGMLRRHAPPALKVLTTAGAAIVGATILFSGGAAPASTWGLGAYVLLSLSAITILLLSRDRASLSRQENVAISALIAGGSMVTAASVTDFLPAAPVGLSGIGAAVVALILVANPTAIRDSVRVLAELAVLAVLATLMACVLTAAEGHAAAVGPARLAAILLSLLLAGDVLVSALGRGGGRFDRRLIHALAGADLADLDRFLESLADQPALADLRMAEGDQLSEYDTTALAAALAGRPVWTPAALASQAPLTRPLEQLADLLERTWASHAIMISALPLRIALLTLPEGGSSLDLETDLALFGKLASIASRSRP